MIVGTRETGGVRLQSWKVSLGEAAEAWRSVEGAEEN